jgi:protein TonB
VKIGFTRNLIVVGFLHALTLVILFSLTASRSPDFEPPPVRFIPVELVAETQPVVIPGPDRLPPDEPPPEPEPEIAKPPEPKPRPKPEPRPKKRVVRRRVAPQPGLSQKDIEDLLSPALDSAAPVTPPNASDATCRALIYQTFHDAWDQPAYADAGDAVAFVVVQLNSDGSVASRKLSKSSGNSLLDATAMKAAESVRRIPGLSADFIARNKTITVSFRVTEDN